MATPMGTGMAPEEIGEQRRKEAACNAWLGREGARKSLFCYHKDVVEE